ncbi:hypothetical protein [Nocardia sp. NPDC050710]|uniref:hypothetical protein n=1 Tax=Nocardia sp. NPDC050710 TaxID=3157220 RepID=UPI0033E1AF58
MDFVKKIPVREDADRGRVALERGSIGERSNNDPHLSRGRHSGWRSPAAPANDPPLLLAMDCEWACATERLAARIMLSV